MAMAKKKNDVITLDQVENITIDGFEKVKKSNVVSIVPDKKLFLDGHTEKIRKTIGEITHNFMYIAFLLWEVREYEYYASAGYKSVTEYGEKELGMDSGTTSRMIKLCETYSSRTKSGSPSMHLSEQFKLYGHTQLVEMLPIPPERREEVKPDMTKKEIRQFRKKMKEETALAQVKAEEKLATDTLNEIKCDNCGNAYFADKQTDLMFIEISGKYVGPCCYKTHFAVDLLKKTQGK